MENIDDYTGNVLDITDEEIAENWELGLLRAMGRVVSVRGKVEGGTGAWGITTPGSDRAHVENNYSTNVAGCPLVEIHDVKEDRLEHYPYGSDERVQDNLILAKGTCKCGHVKNATVYAELPAGGMLREIIYLSDTFNQ